MLWAVVSFVVAHGGFKNEKEDEKEHVEKASGKFQVHEDDVN